jgi:hypothetical protein
MKKIFISLFCLISLFFASQSFASTSIARDVGAARITSHDKHLSLSVVNRNFALKDALSSDSIVVPGWKYTEGAFTSSNVRYGLLFIRATLLRANKANTYMLDTAAGTIPVRVANMQYVDGVWQITNSDFSDAEKKDLVDKGIVGNRADGTYRLAAKMLKH